MKVEVPGNLLLLGEYAITLPGGVGIAVALSSTVTFTTAPAHSFHITGSFEGTTYQWTPGVTSPPLLSSIVETVGYYPPLHIHIDASPFCYPDGRKKGLGSSAATTLGLVYILLRLRLGREPNRMNELFPLALQIHRTFQGGRGSGYDILTSLMGGVGVFKGGLLPSWTPLEPQFYSQFFLKRGEEKCSTKEALERFEALGRNFPSLLRKFCRLSDRIVHRFAAKNQKKDFQRAARLNCWLHHRLRLPTPWKDLSTKSLGAGGEIGACFQEDADSTTSPLIISLEGLRCTL